MGGHLYLERSYEVSLTNRTLNLLSPGASPICSLHDFLSAYSPPPVNSLVILAPPPSIPRLATLREIPYENSGVSEAFYPRARARASAARSARLQRAREINGIVSSVRATRNRARRCREIVTALIPVEQSAVT